MYIERIRGKNVVVVDMTHGGMELCDSYSRYGANVTAVDVHGTLKKEELACLSASSIPVFKTFNDALVTADPHLVTMQYSPNREDITQFCGEEGIPLLTHARATGLILSDMLGKCRIVEITGAYGKTTTVTHLESILVRDGEESMVMSSKGVKVVEGDNVRILDGNGSITPAYALKAVRITRESGYNPKNYVFEISLGGLGIGSVCAVLGVPLHLRVGVNRSSFFSKAQMAQYIRPTSVLCLNGDDDPTRRMEMMAPSKTNMFSVEGDGNVVADKKALNPDTGRLTIDVSNLSTVKGNQIDTTMEFSPNRSYFGRSAVSNFLAAASIALSMNMDELSIVEGLEKSVPPDNRLVASNRCGCTIISSTATSKETIDNAIVEAKDYAELTRRRLSLLIGGLSKTTCGKVDFDGLSSMLKCHILDGRNVALYGELGSEMAKRGCNAPMFSTKD
nr:hypothetical protein [Candidatus Methanofastidiosa archaeon]